MSPESGQTITGLIPKRGFFYYWPPQVDGIRPKRIALRTKDRAKAIQMVLEIQRRHFRQTTRGRLSGEIERFLQAKKESAEYRPKTAVVTESTLRLFCVWAGDPLCSDVNSETIDEWKAHMVKEGRSMSGVRVASTRDVTMGRGTGRSRKRPRTTLVVGISLVAFAGQAALILHSWPQIGVQGDRAP